MAAKGLLLVLVDPAAALEEELNDWYDTEHLPERAAVPGFETARRFTSLGDGPRYAAVYDLASLDVLASAAYCAVSGANFSPWTRRITNRCHPFRIAAHQIGAGEDVTGSCSRLLILKFAHSTLHDRAAIAAGLDASFAGEPNHLKSRIFAGIEPEPDFMLAMAEFAGDHIPRLMVSAFGECGSRIALAASYRPYCG